jgi:hypothetical protein
VSGAAPIAAGLERSRVASDSRSARWLAIGFTALVLAPVVAVIITRSWHSYLPTGDLGVTDLRVRDVWNGDFPLVGPFSRYGWSHPGPMFFLLLALPYRLFGRAAWVTMVGAAVLQGIAIGWLASLAWRRGRLPLLMATLTAVSLVYASVGSKVVMVPWNPYVPLPFFCLFLFQCWLVATGDAGKLPGLAVVASFLVQTHVGYAPLVLGGLVVVGWFAYRDRVAGMWANTWRRSVMITSGLVVLLWLPPVIDVVVNWPGNVERILKYFVKGSATESTLGLHGALQMMAAEFRLRPAWLGASDSTGLLKTGVTASVGLLAVPVVLLVGAWWLTRHRPVRNANRMLALATVVLVFAVVALARVRGWPFPYLFLWRPAVAVFIVFAAVGTIVVGYRLFDARAVRISFGCVSVALVAIFSGSMAVAVLADSGPVSPLEDVTRSMVRQAEAAGVPRRGVLLEPDPTSLFALQKGIFDELDRRGERVFVDDSVAYQYGDQHAASPKDVAAVWWVAESGWATTMLRQLPGAHVVASFSRLPRQLERESEQLQAKLAKRFVALGHPEYVAELDSPYLAFQVKGLSSESDQRDVLRLARLNNRFTELGGVRASIVAFPPAQAPDHLPYSEYVKLG